MTACLIKINKNENLSDAEKSQLTETMQNLTDALDKQNTGGSPQKATIENSGNFPKESVTELHSELVNTSTKLDKYSNKLDKTHSEIKQLHEKLDKIYRTYGAGKSAAIIHPGTNEANRQNFQMGIKRWESLLSQK